MLLGAYTFGANSFQYASLSPEDRIKVTLEYGSQIHPQYKTEYQNGVAVAWHRVPWTLGCAGHWTEELRAQHFKNMTDFDGRIVLAGEHVSRLPLGRRVRCYRRWMSCNVCMRAFCRVDGEQ